MLCVNVGGTRYTHVSLQDSSEVRDSMRLVITKTHTHTQAQSSCLAVCTETSVTLCVKAGGWISISTAARSILHTPLSDSHIIQCRKSCSSFINIRPYSPKTHHRQQKNMTAYERQNIHHGWGGKVGSGETADCLSEPDNVVFVYC